MADTLTAHLRLTKPDLASPADVRVLNADLDVIDAAVSGNMLTNGGLELWQRGNGPFATNGGFAADRWQISLAAGTLSVARDTANADAGSVAAAVLVYTHAGGPFSRLLQALENYAQLGGRTVAFSARVKASVPNAVRLAVWDSVNGFRYSGFHTGSGVYETLAVSAPVALTATGVQVGLHLEASATAYLDSARLGLGAAAVPYGPLHPTEELARCLRYYQEIGDPGVPGAFVGSGFVTSATVAQVIVRYATEMAVPPTVALSAATDFEVGSAAGASIPCTALAVSTPSLTTRRECRLIATVAGGLVAGNATFLRGSNANARIRLEANP